MTTWSKQNVLIQIRTVGKTLFQQWILLPHDKYPFLRSIEHTLIVDCYYYLFSLTSFGEPAVITHVYGKSVDDIWPLMAPISLSEKEKAEKFSDSTSNSYTSPKSENVKKYMYWLTILYKHLCRFTGDDRKTWHVEQISTVSM